MVTATTLSPEVLPGKLPDASTSEVPDQPEDSISLGLTLLEDGSLLLDGQPSTPEALRQALKDAKATTDDVTVLLGADRMVAHGRIVWALDVLRSEGVGKYAFNVDKSAAIPPDPASEGRGAASP